MNYTTSILDSHIEGKGKEKVVDSGSDSDEYYDAELSAAILSSLDFNEVAPPTSTPPVLQLGSPVAMASPPSRQVASPTMNCPMATRLTTSQPTTSWHAIAGTL